MRGRGFGRGAPQSRNDMFRSRAPNTSRPPSMHVDDFMKMENQTHGQTIGPTGMNPHLRAYREKVGHECKVWLGQSLRIVSKL